jgi:hypothetical protein
MTSEGKNELFDDVFVDIIDSMLEAEESAKEKKTPVDGEFNAITKEKEKEKELEGQVGAHGKPSPDWKKYYNQRMKPIPYAITMKKMVKIYKSWEDLGLKALFKPLFGAQYLFGGRISEMLHLKKMDFELTSSLTPDGEIKDFLECSLTTLKQGEKITRDSKKFRQIVIPTWGEDKCMVDDLLAHLDKFDGQEYLFQITNRFFEFMTEKKKLDPHARKRAWDEFSKIDYGPIRVIETDATLGHRDSWFGTTHYLRRCRLSHLYVNYGWDAELIKVFAGWKSTKMLGTYVNIGAKEMKEMLIRRL